MLLSGRNAAKAFRETGFWPLTRRAVIPGVLLLLAGAVVHAADQQERRPDVPGGREYPVKGMVLRVDPASRTMIVSHEKIAGLMDAMAMPFEVRDSNDLQGIAPGAVVDFTLVVGDAVAYATAIKVRRYESVEQDPVTARRLALLKRIAGMASRPLEVGGRVPDFTLTDQTGRAVSFTDFSGKVVAVNFIYTRCALPQFCLRVTNNFGVVQKRFQRELG